MSRCQLLAAAVAELGLVGCAPLAREADSVPGISLTRSGLTVADEQAVLLDNFHSGDVLRKVNVLNDNHVYTLTFVPWEAAREEFPRLRDLYATVIDSFSFLPGASSEPLG